MGTVLNWMKQFLILYLILTILTQLAAAEAYKKYLRFLSGIIIIMPISLSIFISAIPCKSFIYYTLLP